MWPGLFMTHLLLQHVSIRSISILFVTLIVNINYEWRNHYFKFSTSLRSEVKLPTLHEMTVIYEAKSNDSNHSRVSICVVSKTKPNFLGEYYQLVDALTAELKHNSTTKKEMFNLNCTNLLYLDGVKLVGDPRLLLDNSYNTTGMKLFGSMHDGFIMNLQRFRLNYTNDMALQMAFTSRVNKINLYGSNKLLFCGEMYGYGPADSPILIREKHQFINRIFRFYKPSFRNSLVENEISCWTTLESEPIYIKNIVYGESVSRNCDNIRGVMNGLPGHGGWEPRAQVVAESRDLLESYLPLISRHPIPDIRDTRGIAMLIYGKIYNSAYENLVFMRKYVTELPFEVFHNEELDSAQIEELMSISNLIVVSIASILKEYEVPVFADHNYHYKFSALLSSSFRHIIFLDADSLAMSDPNWIFDSHDYKQSGLVMFPDMWKTDTSNPIYDILGFNCVDEMETEAGQFVIDKHRHHHTVVMSFLMTKDQHVWYKFLFGDKDVMRWVNRYLGRSIYIENTFVKSVGFKIQDFRCGQTMVQSYNGIKMFFHANLIKYTKDVGRWNFGGYQEYKDIAVTDPQFYLLNSWSCVAYNGGRWVDGLDEYQPFLNNYLDFKKIN
eukprot:NODE_219_length_14015_cov_0.496335.p1 type:complete len:610 gc:universal NODE_219_length_14015_cov_0.496335:13054-11225(-)